MFNFANKSVLVVAPHLDDVELRMGGTLSEMLRSIPKPIHHGGLLSAKCGSRQTYGRVLRVTNNITFSKKTAPSGPMPQDICSRAGRIYHN